MIISTFKNESYHYDFPKNLLNVNIFLLYNIDSQFQAKYELNSFKISNSVMNCLEYIQTSINSYLIIRPSGVFTIHYL